MTNNIHADLVRRSIENYLITRRRNHREDDVLERKFALYQRQHRLIDHSIHMAQYRFERHAREDFGYIITCKRKPFQSTNDFQLHYPIKDRYWTMKEYSVEPLYHTQRNLNSYDHVFARRSRQYADELKEKKRLYKFRKDELMNEFQSVIKEQMKSSNDDGSSLEYRRVKLPPMDWLLTC